MCRLYEMWRANITGGVFYGGCLAVWQIDQVYPPSGRGENCTSADAAGLPLTPLVFTVASDSFTTNKWSTVGFGTGDLTSLSWNDFEMVDGGQRYQYDGNCTHTPVTQ
jgi:hypothetical protein